MYQKVNMLIFHDFAAATVGRAKFRRQSPGWSLAVFVVLVAAAATVWLELADAPGHAALLPQAHAQTPDTGAFVTTWNTTGTSIGTKSLAGIGFHIGVASGGQVTIDWGDGSPPRSYNASGSADHYYIYDGPAALRNSSVDLR